MAPRLILSGLRSIEEALKVNPKRFSKLLIPAGKLSPRIENLRALAAANGIRIELNPKPDPQEPVLALLRDHEYIEFEVLCSKLSQDVLKAQSEGQRLPVVLLLDGITDPQNLGALLRTAAFMAVSGIVIPKDRSAEVNQTVYRVASGGVEHLRISQVTNLVSALASLKEIGFWTVGLSEHTERSLFDLKIDFPCALVVGNEEKGIRPLVLKNCDYLVKIPAPGPLKSLNASVAGALGMAWTAGMLHNCRAKQIF